ncbi:MAG: response regulator transcription factor [Solimonas sp.]
MNTIAQAVIRPWPAAAPTARGGGDGWLYATLTTREREAFDLVIEGCTTRQIAVFLQVGVKTAENHRRRMMEKIGVRNRVELIRYAMRHGLLRFD